MGTNFTAGKALAQMPAHLPGGDRGLRAAVFVVVVELLAIPLYLFVEKPLAKYMKKYEWQNLRPVDPL